MILLIPNDSTNFFDPDENVMKMAQDFYSKVQYEIVGDPTITETTAEVNVSMTLPDMVSIINDVSNDIDFMATILKPYARRPPKGCEQASGACC